VGVRLSEADIARLVAEPKRLCADPKRLALRPKRGHEERDLALAGASGSQFRLILRRSRLNPLDFSVILAYRLPDSSRLFRLRRYNGRSHEHRNRLEGTRFYDFHIHYATERYQDLGAREDAYAESADTFSTLEAARELLFAECGVLRPENDQLSLFEG